VTNVLYFKTVKLSFRKEFYEAICSEESVKTQLFLDFSTPLRCAQNDSFAG